MDPGGVDRCRVIGDYILGPRIGSGSFAVVWRSRHRQLGLEVAVKEIDKKHLSHKVNDNLLKEVTILRNIKHPNIIRLHEAIETDDKIYLVLEYCDGGDLAAYVHRHGRVSEALARHFMRQLASGLQALRENNLIHRDLKPQNLLLSNNEATPVLKIGDFGFARYLTPQGLADTLCGSPLYMAPEIIQNQKYDAKADLWSVGAILFQLVTGKPPFDGNNQFQLFQNILTSNELRFPEGALEKLHPDCVDLCKSLLRQNPVERLTFEELFNHKFLALPRPTMDVDASSLHPEIKALVEQFGHLADDKLPVDYDKDPKLISCSSGHDESNKLLPREDQDCKALPPGTIESVCGFMINTPCENIRKSVDGDHSNSSYLQSMNTGSVGQQLFVTSVSKVADSLESIEKEYVLVNAHFASTETFSSSLEESLQDNSAVRLSHLQQKKFGKDIVVAVPPGGLAASSVCCVESPDIRVSTPLAVLQASPKLGNVPQGSSQLHPSTRLRLFHQYIKALSDLVQKKLDAGTLLESFSVELVALALWREALRVCSSWVASTAEGDSPGSCSANEYTTDQEGAYFSLYSDEGIDFSRPSSVLLWVKQGFIVAYEHAEKMSNQLRDMDGSTEMPDAMEIIFQTALAAGKSGAADELIENMNSAALLYSKATVLLSFIVEEATLLPLNPPFSLSAADQQRIQRYIINLRARQTNSQMLQQSPKQTLPAIKYEVSKKL